MITIGKRFTFDAAHRLGRHEGKCGRPHGHTYILEIDFTGPLELKEVSSQNMIVDYYEVTAMVKQQIESQFDHRDLNVEMKRYLPGDPETENVTTAENMVGVFATIVGVWLKEFFPLVTLTRVRLCETQNTWCEWRPNPIWYNANPHNDAREYGKTGPIA